MELPETYLFSIQTEVAPVYLNDLLVFIYQKYIVPFYRSFANVRQWKIGERGFLAFTFLDPRGSWHVDVEIAMGTPIEIKMSPSSREVPLAVLNRLKEDLIITVQMFEEKIRRTTFYFAWVQNKDVVPEKPQTGRRKILSQIFLGNMIIFFAIFLAFSYLVFLIAREYTPIILVLAQFVIVLFSDKIIMRLGDWTITADNPSVHILQYHIPEEELEVSHHKYTRELLTQIKKKIYDNTLALGKSLDQKVIMAVFSEYGINLKPENLLTKTVNVYAAVKEAVSRLKMPIPKVRIANVIVPNAAATGPSPRFSLVLITTGLLVQLDQEEILAVIGHEISHLKGRDPLVLFALVSAEYLLRVYVLWQYIFLFGFLYFLFALGVVFFIAKFFEARADLESAIKMGNPEILATALTKIGYRRIQAERMTPTRIGRWIGLDPHPPISFRVERLENLKEPWKIKHTFIQSIKDCINGFLKEL